MIKFNLQKLLDESNTNELVSIICNLKESDYLQFAREYYDIIWLADNKHLKTIIKMILQNDFGIDSPNNPLRKAFKHKLEDGRTVLGTVMDERDKQK